MEQSKRHRRLGAGAWRELLERFAPSGLTVEAYCHGAAVSPKTFHRWRARLAAPANRRSASTVAVVREPATGFVDLGRLGTPAVASPLPPRLELHLDLGGGLLLHLVRS